MKLNWINFGLIVILFVVTLTYDRKISKENAKMLSINYYLLDSINELNYNDSVNTIDYIKLNSNLNRISYKLDSIENYLNKTYTK